MAILQKACTNLDGLIETLRKLPTGKQLEFLSITANGVKDAISGLYHFGRQGNHTCHPNLTDKEMQVFYEMLEVVLKSMELGSGHDTARSIMNFLKVECGPDIKQAVQARKQKFERGPPPVVLSGGPKARANYEKGLNALNEKKQEVWDEMYEREIAKLKGNTPANNTLASIGRAKARSQGNFGAKSTKNTHSLPRDSVAHFKTTPSTVVVKTNVQFSTSKGIFRHNQEKQRKGCQPRGG